MRILEASVCLSSQVENGSGSEDIDRDNWKYLHGDRNLPTLLGTGGIKRAHSWVMQEHGRI